MATAAFMKRQLILSSIQEHNESIKHLEMKYRNYITNLLQQKNRIIIKMQQQFYHQMEYIYDVNQQNKRSTL